MTDKAVKVKDYDVIQRPVITEKSQGSGKYFFEVPMVSTKADVRRAVSTIFGVTVKSVNTLVRKGKTRRFKGREGQQSDKKIAMVTLQEGQVIDLGLGA
jgi:large subunit ribosomal protein L23